MEQAKDSEVDRSLLYEAHSLFLEQARQLVDVTGRVDSVMKDLEKERFLRHKAEVRVAFLEWQLERRSRTNN